MAKRAALTLLADCDTAASATTTPPRPAETLAGPVASGATPPDSPATASGLEQPHETISTPRTVNKRRSFKGLSLEERQQERREKLIQAGLQVYGTQGFFSVTVRDVCNEAKLTERYFYESFKRSEMLFKTIFLRLIEQLQQTILTAIMHSKPEPRHMIEAGLAALFGFLQHDPRMARILYIDAILVQEMQGSTIPDSIARFDRMIQAILLLVLPQQPTPNINLSLISTGLNGYITQIAVRWVMGGFSEPREQILTSCQVVLSALLQWFEQQPASPAV